MSALVRGRRRTAPTYFRPSALAIDLGDRGRPPTTAADEQEDRGRGHRPGLASSGPGTADWTGLSAPLVLVATWTWSSPEAWTPWRAARTFSCGRREFVDPVLHVLEALVLSFHHLSVVEVEVFAYREFQGSSRSTQVVRMTWPPSKTKKTPPLGRNRPSRPSSRSTSALLAAARALRALARSSRLPRLVVSPPAPSGPFIGSRVNMGEEVSPIYVLLSVSNRSPSSS